MKIRCNNLKLFITAVVLVLLSLGGISQYALASDDTPSVMPEKDWWIMIGPKAEKDNPELRKDLEQINRQFPSLQPELSNTSDFFWLPEDQWALFIGPESSKNDAESTLAAVQKIQKEAKLVQTARRSPRPMPWFTGRWLVTWPNGNLNSMKLSVSRDSYLISGTVMNDLDSSCGVSGKCSAVDKAMLSVSCPTSGLAFDMSLTLEDMNTGSGEFYLKGQKGPLSITRN